VSPSPPFTKSYGIPSHVPGSPAYGLSVVSARSYWNPIQSGEENPWVSYGATAETPCPNRRASTRNRPWNAGSFLAYRRTYHRSTTRMYPLSDGGDSGPVKYRMSVITSGPLAPVVRRITPSGDVYFGEVFAGVIHPFTHVVVVSPRRGGGDAGGDGGTTGVVETLGEEAGEMTAEPGVVGFATSAPPSHAASVSAAAATTAGANLPIRLKGLRRTGPARIPPRSG
jgi:hypothetical protein